MISWLLRILIGNKTLAWLTASFTDDKGEASARRISAFYLMMLYGVGHTSFLYVLFTSSDAVKPDLAKHTVWLLLVDVLGAALYIGLITVQNVLTFSEIIKRQPLPEQPSQPEQPIRDGKNSNDTTSQQNTGAGEQL